MSIRAGYSTPMIHVADVARSIRFYRELGFEPIDVQGEPVCPVWARMHCEGGAIMFLASEHPVDARSQSILLYLYTDDLRGLREQLLAAGSSPSPIEHPEHMPSGEMRIVDPDGYVILIGHWGDAEHQEWEQGRKRRLEAAGLV